MSKLPPDTIPKAYEAKTVEDSIYKTWEESGFFNPDALPGKRSETFTIMMPPPNATGMLHVGHAVMLAIEDIVIRFQRMLGKKTLWLPGTDHAAIATNAKVERLIKEQENKTKEDLGREEFLKRVHAYIAESQSTMKNQIRKMGSSCDWSRERYTFDQGLTNAVNHGFVEMYHDDLIYRGDRIVNWCPHCQSTLADDEVEYKEERAPFYYFKYGPVVIGTARPETKFGDKVIIVHPDDKRYQDIVGKEMEVEWILGPIKARVIADKAADMEMGSGAMTITPAHSFVDFDLAKKYHIPIEKIIDEQGKLTVAAGTFAGLTVKEARHKVFNVLKEKGLVEKVDEDYVHNLSVCYRCGTPIEPLVSKQWFIDVSKPLKKLAGKSLKEKAIEVVRGGDIEIIPEHFNKVYFNWMEHLHDWCISRQIWFGHQLPVWYKGEEIYVGLEAPKGQGWVAETDTLDTWFSSGMWTFSTLGWPDKTKDLKTFHPTQLMETGYDILPLWVARMIIMSTYLMGEIPFEKVYLHGLVRDEKGRKMSKSLGNSIDPLDTIAKFGADATRLSLIIGSTPGNDTNMSEAKIEGYRNFVNKLWNISRYILLSVEKVQLVAKAPKPKTLADQWILNELNQLIEHATENLAKYNLSIVGERVYEFSWAKLADWYLEVTKIEKDKDEMLLYILQTLLKLWHPFTPFVTEEIWKKFGADELLMVQTWPKAEKLSAAAVKQAADFELIQELVVAIRNLRTQAKVPPAKLLSVVIASAKHDKLIADQAEVIKKLARLEKLDVSKNNKKPAGSLSAVVAAGQIYLPVSGMLDIAKELKRLSDEEKRVADFVIHLQEKLKNERFLERAPVDIIAKEKEKLAEHIEKLEQIKQQLKTLK